MPRGATHLSSDQHTLSLQTLHTSNPGDLQWPRPRTGSHSMRSELCPLLGVLGQATGLLCFPAAGISLLRCGARPAGAVGPWTKAAFSLHCPNGPPAALPGPEQGPPLLKVTPMTAAQSSMS